MVFVTAVGLLAAASCAYYLAAVLVLWRHSRDEPSAPTQPKPQPGITILKPAASAGADFVDLLSSHAAQDYPDFEILVGVGGHDRAARAAVRKVQADSPRTRIQLVDCPEPARGCNGKVEALQELARHASKPVWVLSDADIEVPRGYLANLSAELQEPNTGMVTCLYRAEPDASLLTRLEACRINTEFPAQVLLAKRLQGLRFGLGSSMALRAETLASVGGFPALRNVIGDDYHLGARIAAAGLSVRLSSTPVSTRLSPGTTWRQSWRRQLRWSRTIRKQRPLGRAGIADRCGHAMAARGGHAQPAAASRQVSRAVGPCRGPGTIAMDRPRRGPMRRRSLARQPVRQRGLVEWPTPEARPTWTNRQLIPPRAALTPQRRALPASLPLPRAPAGFARPPWSTRRAPP